MFAFCPLVELSLFFGNNEIPTTAWNCMEMELRLIDMTSQNRVQSKTRDFGMYSSGNPAPVYDVLLDISARTAATLLPRVSFLVMVVIDKS